MWKKLLIVSLFFIISVVTLITLSLFSFQRFNVFVKYTEAVDHHHIMLTRLNQLRVDLTGMESNQRAFLLFQDSAFLKNYDETETKIKKTFAGIHEQSKGNREQLKRLQSLNLLIRSRIDFLHTDIVMGEPQTDYNQGRIYMEKCMATITEMEDAENTALHEVIQNKEFYQSTTPKNFRIVFILTLTVFAISFGFLIQQYRDRVKYQDKLEKNIVELNQVNSEWEQIAYAASHDLQEPLRKIRTFSGILESKYLPILDEDGQGLVRRIDAASARAQSLMHDIVNYNLIVYPREELSPVDMKEIYHNAVTAFEAQLKKINGAIYTDHLPLLRAYPTQILLLLKCLIDNSIKFSRPDDSLKITIAASIVQAKELPVDQHLSFTHFHKIIFEDNGIGFENQFSDKIFKMFQRLHTQDSPYDGRGIGLAIVKRIMTNHMGVVVARGRPGKGAKFTLYFPVR